MKNSLDCNCPCYSGSVVVLVPCCDSILGYLKKKPQPAVAPITRYRNPAPLPLITHPLRKHAKTSKAILNSFALFGRTRHLPSGGGLSIRSMSDRNAVKLLHVRNPARIWDEASMSLNVILYFVVGWFHGWRQPTRLLTPFAMA